MNRFKQLISALALALAACGAPAEPPSSSGPMTASGPATASTASTASVAPTSRPGAAQRAATSANPADSLAALRALNVIDVGGLIENIPAEATQCYGPCPGYEKTIADARAQSRARLSRLAAVATSLQPAAADPQTCEPAAIEANLAALRSLRIVEVKGFLAAQPKSSPQCYNMPCPEDREQARAQTCERAATLADLARNAQGL